MAYWPWSLLAQPEPLPERILTAVPETVVDDALGGWGSPATAFPAEIRDAYVEALRNHIHAHAICEEYRAAATVDREHDRGDRANGRRIACPLLALWSAKGPLGTWYEGEGGPLALWRGWGEDVRGHPLDAGHFFPEETPERTAGALSCFFGGVEVSPSRPSDPDARELRAAAPGRAARDAEYVHLERTLHSAHRRRIGHGSWQREHHGKRTEGACMRRLVYHVSATQDGFIAGPGGEFDFFVMNDDLAETLNVRFPETIPTDLRGALGITEDNKVFDTVLMGRKTYEVGLPHGIVSPYRQLRQYVFSTTLDGLPGPDIELVGGDPVEKVRELKAEDGMDIWLCGGGTLAGALYHEIDALILKRHPILIGAGLPLVVGDFSPRVFDLTEQFVVEGGVVISTYEAPRRRPA